MSPAPPAHPSYTPEPGGGPTGRPRVRLRADADHAAKDVSPTLFGLFHEDLNRSCDGGLNANMVANHSFEGVYLNRRLHNELIAMTTKRRPRRAVDPARHWGVVRGSLRTLTRGALRHGATYARITPESGSAIVENHGYQPSGAPLLPAMTTKADAGALFSAWVRTDGFDGSVEVRLLAADGDVVSSAAVVLPAGRGWQAVRAEVPASRDERVFLQVVVAGGGYLDLDEVSLMNADYWQAGDPRWSQGRFRRDIVESLRELSPTFLRFPGGCVVEGIGDGNAYDWKKTVGPLHRRVPDFNLWALRTPDGDYSQSHQIGFYEYFLLCEDLGIAAVPVVSAGISCQFRSRQSLARDGDGFAALRQDILDLVDWATGDPDAGSWAALRAEAGHPEPFELRYLCIGNENHGEEYLRNFQDLRSSVEARHPGIRTVLSAGPFARGAAFDKAWSYAAHQDTALIVDEHFYKEPQWFTDNTNRYDSYPRGTATVLVGEYAAHPPTSGIGKPKGRRPNSFRSALAEAAFLTGVERNADVVEMTSYAPLLNRAGTRNWDHNLIDFSPDAVMHTANYEVQSLFAGRLGTRIVPVEVLSAVDGVHSSSTATGTEQFLKLVNTTGTAVEAIAHVPRSTGAQAVATVLTADPDTANSLAFEGPPVVSVVPVETTYPIRDRTLTLTLPPHSVIALTVTV